ncbi:hypothetical protein DNTS_017933 [Danionella cerebrum]|uniref:RING-type E3 ubiquitin transferase n=1 Tax=Danionella cerebrum TaxID=2873325 RepID=A0A553MSE1_9TELE|nr:hypothetical protein DNTS_017933 [Danionella translucida]
MAERGFSLDMDQFTCSICLELLKDPVTIPCGHSYCMDCITDCWKEEDQKKVYSCPQCRQSFAPRPALNKNVMFAEVVEELKKKKEQRANLSLAEAGDVECDVCTGRKYKAIKSCLMCLNSYCHNHLEQHTIFFKDKKHELIDATGRLRRMVCGEHNRLLEVYCYTDQKCICLMCVMEEHAAHHVASVKTERAEKQKQLLDIKRTSQQRIKEREQEVKELTEALKAHKAAVKDCKRVFKELLSFIEKKQSEVINRIIDQEKTEVSRVEELLKVLEQEIDDLKKSNAELEKLSLTEDHIYFLESFQSFSVNPACEVSTGDKSLLSYDDVAASMFLLRKKLEDLYNDTTGTGLGKEISYKEIINTSGTRTREDFLIYFGSFTLDSNTAHNYIRLSGGNRVATFTGADQRYPAHPDRFQEFSQVLCRESVQGRCYWELDWSGEAGVGVSVSYKSISRKGNAHDSVLGFNGHSWRLTCSASGYAFRHNQKMHKLPIISSCSRIGVYVDHRAGILCFFIVSDTMHLIHSVQTTFTQPLYPGFELNFGSSVKLLSP